MPAHELPSHTPPESPFLLKSYCMKDKTWLSSQPLRPLEVFVDRLKPVSMVLGLLETRSVTCLPACRSWRVESDALKASDGCFVMVSWCEGMRTLLFFGFLDIYWEDFLWELQWNSVFYKKARIPLTDWATISISRRSPLNVVCNFITVVQESKARRFRNKINIDLYTMRKGKWTQNSS